jgi:hypothetical protein
VFPAEICDGDEARADLLEDHCGRLCMPAGEPVNADVVFSCDFECNADCNGFVEPADIQDPGCCLSKGSPCPNNFDMEGVPDLPCCSWAEHPDWLAQKLCVNQFTEQGVLAEVCP